MTDLKTERNRTYIEPHERAIETQILDALLRIEELLQPKTPYADMRAKQEDTRAEPPPSMSMFANEKDLAADKAKREKAPAPRRRS